MKTSHALFDLTETTPTVYIHGRMNGNGVNKHFDMELTGQLNMDDVLNAKNEHRRSNRKKCRNATYFKPRSEILQIIHYKESQIIPCSLELSGHGDFLGVSVLRS